MGLDGIAECLPAFGECELLLVLRKVVQFVVEALVVQRLSHRQQRRDPNPAGNEDSLQCVASKRKIVPWLGNSQHVSFAHAVMKALGPAP